MSTVDVYWSNAPIINTENPLEKNYFYEEPKSVLRIKSKQRPENKTDGAKLFNCPAVTNFLKNVYRIDSPLDMHFKYNGDVRSPVEVLSKEFLPTHIEHNPSMENETSIVVHYPFIFFSEEDMEIIHSSPYFDKTEYTQYGHVVPGKLNISKWFRPVQVEINLYSDELIIKKDEPLLYTTFLTDKNVRLKRFTFNDKLVGIMSSCVSSSSYSPNKTLEERYERFIKSQSREIVLKEIRNNLVN